jgi:hypothetical protein
VLDVEDWAEIRRLHRAEGVPIKEIARRLGVARNTVRRALASDGPPKYVRAPKGSVVDPFEPRIRVLLTEWPRMPALVVAERIGWTYSLSPLKRRLALIRPEYVGIDPVDRVVYSPGQVTQCDLWFPETPVPVAPGHERVAPVLVMTLGFSRFLTATMIPSRQAGDILAGMWLLISGVGRVTKTLVWDRESAIGGGGRPTVPAAAFAGTLATRIRLAPPRDPEFKPRVAYCTFPERFVRTWRFRWSRVLAAADLRSLHGLVGVGRVVEVLAFVVVSLGTDNSGSAPGFDRVWLDAVGGGGLGECEHALVA